MKVVVNIKFWLRSILLLIVLTYPASVISAQDKDHTIPRMELALATTLDSLNSNNIIYRKYFGKPEVVEKFTFYVSKYLKRAIEDRLNNLDIKTVSVRFQEDKNGNVSENNSSYLINTTIHTDDEVNLYSKLKIIEKDTKKSVLDVPFLKALKTELSPKRDWRTLTDPVIETIARNLGKRIEEPVSRWIIQSSIKFRVAVRKFNQIGTNDNSIQHYGEMLQTMVESELNRSDAILLHTDIYSDTSENENAKEKFLLNYIIDGKFVKINDQIRIDVRCIKRPFNRILVAKRAIVESVTATEISRVMVDLSNQIKNAMESDFTSQTKTIAFVAKPSTISANKQTSKSNMSINGEIIRTLTQKLSMLTTSIDTSNSPLLNLRVVGYSSDLVKYLAEPSRPSEILADLDIDYLILTSYDDLGEKVRISSSLHSFDSEIPTTATHIYENTVDKIRLNDEIDQTIVNLTNHLCKYGFVSSTIRCGDLKKQYLLSDPAVNMIKMPTILKDKQFGFRFGAVTSRVDKNLFLGEESGSYFEAYYSRILPFLFTNFSGGRFDVGIEAGLGIDTGGALSFSGAAVGNTMINTKLILTKWHYSKTASNIIVGGGLVFQGIRYNFQADSGPYQGTKNFRDTIFRPTFNLFTEIEFPLWDKYAIDILFRYIPPSGKITAFRNVPLEGFAEGNGPTGKLGGTYLIGGIKYLFH